MAKRLGERFVKKVSMNFYLGITRENVWYENNKTTVQ